MAANEQQLAIQSQDEQAPQVGGGFNLPGEAPIEEEQPQNTEQVSSVLGVDWSQYGDLTQDYDPSRAAKGLDEEIGLMKEENVQEAGFRIESAVPKIQHAISKKKERQEIFGFDADLDQYKGNEVGLTPDEALRNTVNFLIGDDLAVLGFEWTKEGVSMNMDNLVQTWSEEPLWQNGLRILSLGMNFIPVAGAINKSMKFGRLGKYLPAKSFQFVDPIDGAKSFRWFERFDSINDERRWMQKSGFLGSRDMKGRFVKPTDKAVFEARSAMAAEQRANKMRAIEKAVEKGEETFQWGGETVSIGAVDKAKIAFHRRFSNSYWAAQNAQTKTFYNKYFKSLDDFSESENFGKVFSQAPTDLTDDAQKAVYKFMHTGDAAHLDNLDDAAKNYFTDLAEKYEAHQLDMFELGAIDDSTLAEIPRHVPAQIPGTAAPNLHDSTISVLQNAAGKTKAKLKMGSLPKLGSETMKRRTYRELDEVLTRLDNGQIISDVENHLLPNFMLDRSVYHNFKFMRDAIKDTPGLAVRFDDAQQMGKFAKAAYIDLEKLRFNGKDTLKNILRKHAVDKLGPNGELPHVSRVVFEEWMGKAGMMEQAVMQKSLLEAMVTFHKTMKTAFNPRTHMTNTFGNMIMQAWRGYNPLDPDNLRVGSKIAKSLRKHGEAMKRATQSGKTLKVKNYGAIDILNSAGKKHTYDMAEVLNDDIFQELIEESAFQNVEGLKHLENIRDHMARDGLSRKVVEGMLGAKKIPGVGRFVDEATEAYLLEDMVPKAQMYLQNLSEGMTKEGAAAAVSRALPMYATVGKGIQKARKGFLPWATFPAEMTRILKNNLQDNPMRLLPWFNATSGLQAMGYITGFGEDFEATQEAKRSLPQYAQTPTTVVGKESATDFLQSVPTGAAIGGAAGLALGRPGMGMAVGAAAGGALSMWQNHGNETDALRGAVMNWLPHSAVMLGQNAPEMMNAMTGKDLKRAIGEGNISQLLAASQPGKGYQETFAMLPAQPLAIFEPLVNILSGKTAYGQDIKATGPGDMLTKTTAGLIGFMSPPIIQTYGYRQTSPDDPLPGGALFGAAVGAVAGGAAGGGLPGVIGGGITGGILGGSANVSRIGEDLGTKVNPRTMRPKDTYADFVLNAFGAMKSYAATPETRAANIKANDAVFSDQRSAIKKQAAYYFVNGREQKAVQYMHMAQQTFERQYPTDPPMAQEQFIKWMDGFIDTVGESPLWGGLSAKEMKAEIKRTRTKLGTMQSQALREWIGGLEAARRNKAQ